MGIWEFAFGRQYQGQRGKELPHLLPWLPLPIVLTASPLGATLTHPFVGLEVFQGETIGPRSPPWSHHFCPGLDGTGYTAL